MDFINKKDFRKQIAEDIKEYQELYPTMKNLQKDEWAFNFWILDKIFKEDENVIEEKIIDYNDKGIDCYIWHEELKNLYIIQNKYYDDNSNVSVDYVFNDFLTRSIGALEKGTYSHSPELQKIYNKYHSDDDFQLFFHLYITNNNKDYKLLEKISSYNVNHKNKEAKVFYLDDIYAQYFNQPIVDTKELTVDIATINSGTYLNIDTKQYKMNNALDARYVLTPVNTLYNIHQKAKEVNYPIFNENIREYLGAKGTVNKKMKATLKDPEDRKNFFYYNNGITIICDEMTSVKSKNTDIKDCNVSFSVKNPQIVNGCQTVSTISEVLDEYSDTIREEEFKNTYVMVKILKISNVDNLYKQIVKYNNSQNSIDEKTFTSNKEEFLRIQSEFERKGFLLKIKQSDEYKFSQQYKSITTLLSKNQALIDKYGLKFKKVKDFTINLEKLLQVFLAFSENSQQAVQKKSQLLVPKSNQYETVTNFIKNPELTINAMLELYLFYLLCEQTKKENDGLIPITFFVIDGFSRFECHGDVNKICDLLSTQDKINKLLKVYSMATNLYLSNYINKNEEANYNKMIKELIDYEEFEKNVNAAKAAIAINI